ncbi:MAG: choline monooxygenase, partial [Gammaproteobacteria bacterium]
TYDAIWPANWKCFVENYMDAYHIFKVHKDTFGKYGSAVDATTMHDGDDNFTYHLVDVDSQTQFTSGSGIGLAHPDNKHLDEFWRRQTVLGCVFPAHTMQLQPDMLWYVTVQPHGIDHFRMRWSVSIPPEIMNGIDNPEQYIEDTRELLIAVNAEDEDIIGKVFQGAKSSQAIPGPYAYLERNVFHFGQYLARQLTK